MHSHVKQGLSYASQHFVTTITKQKVVEVNFSEAVNAIV